MKLTKLSKGILAVAFIGSFFTALLFFTAEDTSAGTYYKVTDFSRAEHYEPITIEVQDGDRLTRNGIEIEVFKDVQTGKYTISNGGYYELYRKNN